MPDQEGRIAAEYLVCYSTPGVECCRRAATRVVYSGESIMRSSGLAMAALLVWFADLGVRGAETVTAEEKAQSAGQQLYDPAPEEDVQAVQGFWVRTERAGLLGKRRITKEIRGDAGNGDVLRLDWRRRACTHRESRSAKSRTDSSLYIFSAAIYRRPKPRCCNARHGGVRIQDRRGSVHRDLGRSGKRRSRPRGHALAASDPIADVNAALGSAFPIHIESQRDGPNPTERWSTILRGEHDMDVDLRQRLRHNRLPFLGPSRCV